MCIRDRLKAHQSLSNKELSLRNKTMVDFYISVIKRYRKELLKLSTLILADAYFSTSTFVNGIKKFLAVTLNDADIEIYHSIVSKTQFFIT